MILKKLKLENIRSYVKEEIGFPEGIVLLSGDIGAGKSTILLSAEFALFGIMKGDLSGEGLLRHGEKQGSVELTFDIDGKEITIKRVLKRTSNGIKQEAGHIIMNGTQKDLTPVELKTIILDLLGYPKELLTKSKALIYRYTVYTPQEAMKHILFDEKEGRLDTLRRIFGIDNYKRIIENTSIYTRSLKEKMKELSGSMLALEEKKEELRKKESDMKLVEEKLSNLKPEIAMAKQDINQKQKNIEEKHNDIKKLQEARNALNVNTAKLKEKAEQKAKAKIDIEKINITVHELKEKLFSLGFEGISSVPEEIEAEIQQREMQIKEHIMKKSELQERLVGRQEKQSELRKEAAEKKALLGKDEGVIDKKLVEEDMAKLQDALNETKIKLSEAINIKRNLEELKSKLSDLKECPTCLQPVSEEHKHAICSKEESRLKAYNLSSLEKQKAENEKKLQELKKHYAVILEKERQLEKLALVKEELSQKEDQLKQLDIEVIKLKTVLAPLAEFDIELMNDEIKKLKTMHKNIHERKHINAMIDEKSNAKENLETLAKTISEEISLISKYNEELGKKLESLKDVEAAYDRLRHELDSAKEKEKQLELNEVSLKKEIEGIQNLADSLRKDIGIKEKAKESMEKIKGLQTWFDDYFVKLVSLMEKHIMNRVHKEFSELFAEWFSTLIEDDVFSVRLDNEFTPIVEQNGYETSLENLSGGEKTAVALAYRLALNKVINDVVSNVRTKDLIILDEPTDGFSSAQFDKVKEVLEELKMKQIIIVSHESKVETFVEHIINISKNNHISSIS